MNDQAGKPEPAQSVDRVSDEQLPAVLEALLFAAGDPLPLEKISQICGRDREELQPFLQRMAARFAADDSRGLLLRQIDDRYYLSTKPACREVLQRLFLPRQRPPLSQAAYETLAIIAYNQPVTRAQVEDVRGVNSDSIISRLIERGLVEEAGNLEAPGRPLLYRTSEQFLIDFGLTSVRELPPMEMLMYASLQAFESSLEEVSAETMSRQISLDQLASGV